MRIEILDENDTVINTAIFTSLADAQSMYGALCRVAQMQDAPPESAQPRRVMTHLQFRRRFTQPEQELADELEVTFEANPALTAAQKRTLRTGYKTFYAAAEVDLDDPAIPPMLGMYVVFGVLAAGRPSETLG